MADNFDLASNGRAVRVENEFNSLRARDIERQSLRFERLPGTQKEGAQVAAILVQPLLEDLAVEKSIKDRRSPIILHIATHGFFLANQDDSKGEELEMEESGSARGRLERLAGTENPLLRSGLALAGVNTWAKGLSPPIDVPDGARLIPRRRARAWFRAA